MVLCPHIIGHRLESRAAVQSAQLFDGFRRELSRVRVSVRASDGDVNIASSDNGSGGNSARSAELDSVALEREAGLEPVTPTLARRAGDFGLSRIQESPAGRCHALI